MTKQHILSMTKQYILDEIRRTAHQNRGEPLGIARFQAETGIKETDWRGKYWARWGDALREAGFTPNELTAAHTDDLMISRYISLVRELGRFPTVAELRLKRRSDRSFPSATTYERFGSKHQLTAKILDHCRSNAGFDDVLALGAAAPVPASEPEDESRAPEVSGYVYMLKSGRNYKIGKTNAFGRRERELAIQLPEKASTVHVIKTDDPNGIEAYWHSRFAAKRKQGEWFALDGVDIAAFKRRKFM